MMLKLLNDGASTEDPTASKRDPVDPWPSHTAPDTLLSVAKENCLNTHPSEFSFSALLTFLNPS